MNDFNTYDDDLDEDTMEDRYLTFFIGEEVYGLAIRNVTEIVGLQRITEVPDMPGYVLGVINLRGAVIPVVDVRLRFGIEQREPDERTCVIVVQLDDISVGLIVDTVSEVLDIPADNVAPPPNVNQNKPSRFVCGLGKIGEQVAIILEAGKLLKDEDLEVVAEAAS